MTTCLEIINSIEDLKRMSADRSLLDRKYNRDPYYAMRHWIKQTVCSVGYVCQSIDDYDVPEDVDISFTPTAQIRFIIGNPDIKYTRVERGRMVTIRDFHSPYYSVLVYAIDDEGNYMLYSDELRPGEIERSFGYPYDPNKPPEKHVQWFKRDKYDYWGIRIPGPKPIVKRSKPTRQAEPDTNDAQPKPVKIEPGTSGAQPKPVKIEPGTNGAQTQRVKTEPGTNGAQSERIKTELRTRLNVKSRKQLLRLIEEANAQPLLKRIKTEPGTQ